MQSNTYSFPENFLWGGAVAARRYCTACRNGVPLFSDIGCMLAYIPAYPLTSTPEDVFVALQGEDILHMQPNSLKRTM
ncbi:hypothetical protein HPL003_03525 [Paenibacillus terrae HPL-003]|uniref:6-phospho-beta-glucosidase n=1 Tax=Paenibacillus terrae (strain HPL-003) TaxID=985665 RepID=G7VT68_PAETH|nr:hypothetical protein HPL003_03525 [Paenibacillus terrae HPL-003]